MPLDIPKTWLTTGLEGLIEQGKEKVLRHVMIKSGNQYHTNDAQNARLKNVYCDIFHVLLGHCQRHSWL